MRKLILFLALALAHQSIAQNKLTRFNGDLRDAASAEHLILSLDDPGASRFQENTTRFFNTRSVRLEGGRDFTAWDSLFASLKRLPKLDELHLDNAEVLTLPGSFYDLKLERLSITGCPGLDYPNLFSRLTRLSILNLHDNELKQLPQEARAMTSLTRLVISGNPGISTASIFSAAALLPQLKHLSIKNNELEDLHESVASLKQLETLDISGNYFSVFPTDITSLQQLDSIRIENNIFEEFGDDANKLSLMDLRYISVDNEIGDEMITLLRNKARYAVVDVVPLNFSYSVASMPSVAAPEFHKNTLIAPPLPSLAKKATIYTIDAAAGGTFVHSGGTRVTIPAGSLTDEKGNAITGQVSVSYREFHDPLDILLSGIPMTYDSGGVRNQFETAGMFEIYASQGDKEIFVKPGASIGIELSSTDAASSFNFYALNEDSKNWDFAGKGGEIKERKKVVELSSAWRFYFDSRPRVNFDTMLLHQRFADTSYFYLHKKRTVLGAKPEKKSQEEYLYSKSPIYLKTVKREKGDPKGIVKFRVMQRIQSRNIVLNNEIRAFDNMVMVYEGPMSQPEFRNHFIKKRRYCDMRFVHSPKSTGIDLQLKDGNGFETLEASVYSEKDNDGMAVRKLDNTYRRYSTALRRNQKKFDQEITRTRDRNRKHTEAVESQMWRTIRANMSDEERAMTKEQWLDYYKELRASMAERETIQANISRNLSISGFGVFNCDQIKRLESPVKILASYTNQQGKEFDAATTYVIDSKIRGVLTYSGAYAGLKEGEIALNPKTTKAILVVGKNGGVGVINGEAIKAMQIKGRHASFRITEVETSLANINDLQALLGM